MLVYNEADNIVNYPAASLHAAILAQRSGAASSSEAKGVMGDTTVVEVTVRYAQGWGMHDFPLSLDLDAWYAMIAAERAALGIGKDGKAQRGAPDLQRSAEPAGGAGGGSGSRVTTRPVLPGAAHPSGAW